MHMAFLSRVFKNLQWYGMTRRSRFVCLLRLIFYIAEREMVLSSPSFFVRRRTRKSAAAAALFPLPPCSVLPERRSPSLLSAFSIP